MTHFGKNLLKSIKCMTKGHHWEISRSKPGYLTCTRCRARTLERPLQK